MSENLQVWASQYPSVQKFERLIRRGRLTQSTYETYLKAIKEFCDLLGYGDPEATVERIRQVEEKEQFFDDLITTFRERGLTDTRINNMYKGVKWWIDLNRIDVDWREIILPSVEAQEEDRAPTKEELKRIMNVCNLRDKALIEVASSSGMRRNTLVTLKVGDVDFDIAPDIARIMVRKTYTIEGKTYKSGRKISKKRTFYVTFITPEAKKLLLEYLEDRRKRGEKITEESPLFTSTRKNELGKFLDKQYLDVHWIRLLKRAHLNEKSNNWHVLHFHTLKKYAETNFINAGVIPSYREFWLGHKGAYLESSYFRGEEKKHLEEYRKAIPHLSILEAPITLSKEDLRRELFQNLPEEMFEPLARKHGLSTSQIKNILAKTKSARSRELEEASKRKAKEEQEHDCQKLIDPNELEHYLKEGWRYIAQVNGKVVIER